jgi:hypothetical protein
MVTGNGSIGIVVDYIQWTPKTESALEELTCCR